MTHPSALLRGLLPPRPVLSHTALNLIVATYIMALLNFGFWTRLFSALPEAPLTAAIFGLAVWALTLLLLELLGPSRLQRPVAAVLIVIAASAQYYERAFGVLIDRELVRAIIETTAAESRHLMTPEMAGTVADRRVASRPCILAPGAACCRLAHAVALAAGGYAVGCAYGGGAVQPI